MKQNSFDFGAPEPEPPRDFDPGRDRYREDTSWCRWPRPAASVENQLPACVVRYFPHLAAELPHALQTAADWLTFLDVVYHDADERYESVRRDVLAGLAKVGAKVRRKALETPSLRAGPADYRCARCDELHPRGQPCARDDFNSDDFADDVFAGGDAS